MISALQFNLRMLSVGTCAAAVYFGIARTAGFVVALGIVVCVAMLMIAMVMIYRARKPPVSIACTLIALICATGLWFLAVDRVFFIDTCTRCACEHDQFQIRVIGIPISTSEGDHHTWISSSLEAFGRPCPHLVKTRTTIYRHWGLCYRSPPGVTPTTLSSALLPEEMEKLRSLAAADPDLAAEFEYRVIVKKDYGYSRRFFDQHFPEEAE